jgi:phosphoribosylformimino-5-aminoimidazole carboxamide ribotide isomerase
LFPAIDLKDGACVRLVRGDMAQATVFSDNPAAQACDFESQGFAWLHVVDLNGAFAGRPVNGDAVAAIVAATGLKVQLGGGIRDLATIEDWLGRGVARVVLGTVALKNPPLVEQACKAFPGQIAVGIDARNGRVAVEGWAEESETDARALGLRYRDAGVAAIIHTDIDRDGAMAGMNVQATADFARDLGTPVIASGGVTSLEDLASLKTVADTGVVGVISGRALYDGRIDPAAALALLAA